MAGSLLGKAHFYSFINIFPPSELEVSPLQTYKCHDWFKVKLSALCLMMLYKIDHAALAGLLLPLDLTSFASCTEVDLKQSWLGV